MLSVLFLYSLIYLEIIFPPLFLESVVIQIQSNQLMETHYRA